MAEQERLLHVQAHDLLVDQLRYRRDKMPEHTALTELTGLRAEAERRRDELASARADVSARQVRAEQELAATESRRSDIDRRMTSGSVTASRELQQMADEVGHLARRASMLEDEVLEAMTESEPLDVELAALADDLARLDLEANEVRLAIAAAEAEIDAQLEVERSARREAAASIGGSLLAEYERLRRRLGGIGAARLIDGRCTGCHLTLPAAEAEAARLAPADELLSCEQCGRILIR